MRAMPVTFGPEAHRTAERVAVEPDRAHLRGNLEDCRAAELFDYLAQLRKSGWMTLRERGGPSAKAALLDGEIVAAECGHLQGPEAALAFLGWKEGWFAFEFIRPRAAGFEAWDVRNLSLEEARLADELGRRKAALPPPDRRLALAVQGPFADPLGCGVGEVASALERAPGLTLEQLEARLPLCPVKVRLALTLLRAAGRLVALAEETGSRPAASTAFERPAALAAL